MKPKQRNTTFPSVLFWNIFALLAEYRQGMRVTEILILSSAYGKTGYYFCPRCHVTMDREFTAFCDRCGQRLDWKDYKKARKVYPGRHDILHT